MKNSASYTNLAIVQNDPPPRPTLKRAVTYSNDKNESGEFVLLIRISSGYISEDAFFTLSPSSTLSSPAGLRILDGEENNYLENIEEGDDDNNVIVINYIRPTSVADIYSQIQAQRLEAMKCDHKAMGWDDSF